MAGEHEKAVEVLEEAKTHINNTILYTALGISYQELGQYQKAEASLQHAWHMVPNRFFPLYLLAKLYDDSNQTGKATAMARQILSKEVKVPSKAIAEMKDEMQKILKKNASLQSNNLIEGQRQEACMREQTASCLPLLLKRKGGNVTKIII